MAFDKSLLDDWDMFNVIVFSEDLWYLFAYNDKLRKISRLSFDPNDPSKLICLPLGLGIPVTSFSVSRERAFEILSNNSLELGTFALPKEEDISKGLYVPFFSSGIRCSMPKKDSDSVEK